MGDQINVDVYTEEEIKILLNCKEFLKYAKEKKKNLIIIDTAGRLAIDDVLMNEIGNIKNATSPSEILFV